MTEEGGAQRVDGELPPPGGSYLRPALLHIGHSWGGGIARWIEDFSQADVSSRHLLLRSCPERNALGARIELVDLTAPGEPLLVWCLDQPVGATAIAHGPYRDLLGQVIQEFGVAAVLVSSLVGHALDVLDTGLPTVVVLHDFYPFCPAFFAWFDGACTECGVGDLKRCASDNPLNPLWSRCRGDEWMALRDAYAQRLLAENVSVVAPSHTIRTRYGVLFLALRAKQVHVIPHGVAMAPTRTPCIAPHSLGEGGQTARLRVLVPGRLSPHKGLHLLRRLLPELASFADVLLLGSGEFGDAFADIPNVRVRSDYSLHELPALVTEFGPDCALLVSVLPESFSYTLSEMQALGVPVVATRLGAFVERIEDGINGFLVAPDASDLLARLRGLAADRSALQRVCSVLGGLPVRSATEMVSDYHALLPSVETSRAHVSGCVAGLVEAVKRARMSAIEQLQGRIALAQQLDASRLEVDGLRADVDEWAQKAAKTEGELDALRIAMNSEVARLEHELVIAGMQRDAILASTSWRVTRPLRALSAALVPVDVPRGVSADKFRFGGEAGEDCTAVGVPESGLLQGDAAGADGSPSEPWAVPGHSRIVVFQGDPVGCRRANGLARTLGLPVADAEPGEAGMGKIGVSAAVVDHGRTVFVYEGGAPDAFSSVPATEGTPRCVVPTRAVAEAAKRLGWVSQITPFPPVAEWGRVNPGVYIRQRELLCVPDAARLVIGLGRADRNSGLLDFARVAFALSERRNGYFFVWVGGRDENWLRAHGSDIGLLVAMRRMALIDDEVFEPWLLAADAYLGCRADGVYDAGAVEALAIGVPVVVRSVDCLPDVAEPAQGGNSCVVAVGGDLADHLLDVTNERRTPSEVTRCCKDDYVGDDAAWTTFAAACRKR